MKSCVVYVIDGWKVAGPSEGGSKRRGRVVDDARSGPKA
jgi:hypothetical protein